MPTRDFVRRGDLYLLRRPPGDPRAVRAFVVASRNDFLEANYSSATCVPVYTTVHGLVTEVIVDERNGLKHVSAARCDEIQRIPRTELRAFIGSLTETQLRQLSRAMAIALDILPEEIEDL